MDAPSRSCDWDFDGDLDLWIANRSGPQVRFLRNDLVTPHHFLAIRLEGKTCNRDAIGARVELTLKNRANREQLSEACQDVASRRRISGPIEQVASLWAGSGYRNRASRRALARRRGRVVCRHEGRSPLPALSSTAARPAVDAARTQGSARTV